MNFLLLVLLTIVLVSADQWAVIVAGSTGIYNYRHQADACHAYQVHKSHGIPEDHIILLSYDDMASNPHNPFPGQLFNQPGDNPPDVYDGCKASYREESVTAEVYKAVLVGDVEIVKNLTGIKNPPVLNSNENDTVFLTFFDHGAPYVIAFPEYKDELTSLELYNTLKTMHEKKMYKKLVYYMEACYSGSMFLDLPDNMNIYAATAANEKESAYGCYCEEEAIVKGQYFDTCLGDYFSVAWMEDADLNKRDETLNDQWNIIFERTNLSHAQNFGDKTWLNDSIWDYIGNKNNNNRKSLRIQPKNPRIKSSKSIINSRDVYMNYLKRKISKSKNEKDREEFISILKEEENYRRVTDNRFNLLVNKVTNGDEKLKSKILSKIPNYHANKECYYDLIKSYKTYCGKSREYTLNYYVTLLNLCGYSDSSSISIINSMKEVCKIFPY